VTGSTNWASPRHSSAPGQGRSSTNGCSPTGQQTSAAPEQTASGAALVAWSEAAALLRTAADCRPRECARLLELADRWIDLLQASPRLPDTEPTQDTPPDPDDVPAVEQTSEIPPAAPRVQVYGEMISVWDWFRTCVPSGTIERVVDRLYDSLAGDRVTFNRQTSCKTILRVMCGMLGGPPAYSWAELQRLASDLHITDHDWYTAATALRASLQADPNIPGEVIEATLSGMLPLRDLTMASSQIPPVY